MLIERQFMQKVKKEKAVMYNKAMESSAAVPVELAAKRRNTPKCWKLTLTTLLAFWNFVNPT